MKTRKRSSMSKPADQQAQQLCDAIRSLGDYEPVARSCPLRWPPSARCRYGQSFHPRRCSNQAVRGTCKRGVDCEKRSSPRWCRSSYARSAPAPPFRGDGDASTGCLPSGHPNRAPPSFHRDHHDLREGGRSFTEADCTTLAGGGLMLMKAVESYLAVRRAAGYKTQRCWQHAATVCSIRYGQGRVFHSF